MASIGDEPSPCYARLVTFSRFGFRLVLMGILVLSVGGVSWWLQRESKRQNLILICMDAVRFDTFWLPERSNLRDSFAEWAARAVRFENAHSVSSWTIPAVASVLTGLLPGQHGAGFFAQPVADLTTMSPSALPPSPLALPQVLAREGYQTIQLTNHPWTGEAAYGLAGTFALVEKTSQPLESALAWMQRCRKPCFISVHLLNVHEYGQPLEKVRRTALEMEPELEAAARASMPLPIREATPESQLWYFEYVHRVVTMRERLADFLQALQALDRLDETVIVAFSDHGEEFGEHGSGGHGKSLFQETLHVPVLAWVPAASGRSVSSPVSLVDLHPTMLEWLGFSSPVAGPGRSLVDLAPANGPGRPTEVRPNFASGIAYGNDAAAVLLGRWNLIHDRVSGEQFIYDLELDPLERDPLASPPLDVELALLGHLETLREMRASQPASFPRPSKELLERLQSLGYLSGASR